MVQWSNGPMDQWTNGPLEQSTNDPMVQWTHGPHFNAMLYSNLQIGWDWDGIYYEYWYWICFFLSELLIVHYLWVGRGHSLTVKIFSQKSITK